VRLGDMGDADESAIEEALTVGKLPPALRPLLCIEWSEGAWPKTRWSVSDPPLVGGATALRKITPPSLGFRVMLVINVPSAHPYFLLTPPPASRRFPRTIF